MVRMASRVEGSTFRFKSAPILERQGLRTRKGFAVHLGIIPFGSKDYLVAFMRPASDEQALLVVPDRTLLQDLAGEEATRSVLGVREDHVLHCPVTDGEYAMLVAHVRTLSQVQS